MVTSSRPGTHHSSSSFGSSAAASTILGAFGRRPRTATNSRDRQGNPTDYSESTDDLQRTTSRNRLSLIARAGIPRSNSSSQVHRVTTHEGSTLTGTTTSRFSFPSVTADGSRGSSMAPQNSSGSSSNRPMSNGDSAPFYAMNRTQSSQSNSGGSALGRYFRRYSQGAGKNMAAALEARSIAAASMENRGLSQDTSGSAVGTSADANSNGIHTSAINDTTLSGGFMSASQTMPALSSARDAAIPVDHASEFVSSTEGALASVALNANADSSTVQASTSTTTGGPAATHRIRLVPHLEATRSLHFEPIERDVVEGAVAVKIGRFTDRSLPAAAANNTSAAFANAAPASGFGMTASGTQTELDANSTTVQSGNAPPAASSTITASGSSVGVPGARGGAILSSAGGGGRVDSGRIAFKSKVVSRGHAEVWCEAGGKFFIRDTKSSSGTFLNHIRLSHPNVESKPFPLKDGDVVQLGVDYQGGTEEIYRCVKMRVELNRGWQRGANQFNVNALRQLRALQGTPLPEPATAAAAATTPKAGSALPTNRQSMNVTDCCICLFSVTVCQALFIAPCSHVFHFKCIRPLIEQHHPGFSCPLCRTFADLDADVEEDEAWQQALLKEAQLGANPMLSPGMIDVSTPMAEEPLLNFSSVGLPLTTGSSTQSFGIGPIMENAVADRDASSRRESSLRRAVLGSSANDESEGSSSHHRHQSTNTPDTSPDSLDNVAIGSSSDAASRVKGLERQQDYQSPATQQDRRPSAPISIRRSQGATSQILPTRSPNEGFAMSPNLLDARTPQNEHFLSTLAEAPPPSRVAMRSIDLGVGDNTLFPNSSYSAERRVSNATHDSSHHGTNEAFTTPAQGNSPPADISPLSAFTRTSQRVSDEDGNTDTNTAHSSTAVHSRGKMHDSIPANMQNAIDFLSGNNSNQSSRRNRESSAVESVGSSDRGSSESRDGSNATPGKVARFFKRNSTALNN